MDDDLFPDGTPEAVGEVVDLVHDDEGEPGEGGGPGIHHVAQHLGRHDDHGCLAVDRAVAGEEADVVGAVAADEVGILLVAQGLDRGRIERLLAAGEGEKDRELADHGLPGAGGGGHEDASTRLDGRAGALLKGVEREVEPRGESVRLGHGTTTWSARGTAVTVTGKLVNGSPSAKPGMPSASSRTCLPRMT